MNEQEQSQLEGVFLTTDDPAKQPMIFPLQPMPPEIEVDASSIGLWLVMDAMDLEHDEHLGLGTGERFQARVDFHQRLLDFAWGEPEVDRYRLVKIIEREREQEEKQGERE